MSKEHSVHRDLSEDEIQQLLPNTEIVYTQVSEIYETDKVPLEHLQRFLQLLFPPQSRENPDQWEKHILFVGCGPADDMEFFRKYAQEIYPQAKLHFDAVEKNAAMVAVANKKHPEFHVTQGDAVDLNQQGEKKYDAIVSAYGTIHERESTQQTILSQYYDKLKPGGLLYMVMQESMDERTHETSSWLPGETMELFVYATTFDKMMELTSNAHFEPVAVFRRPPHKNERQFRKLTLIMRRPKEEAPNISSDEDTMKDPLITGYVTT